MNLWLRELSPTVESRLKPDNVSLVDEYESVLRFLSIEDDRNKTLKKKIFGTSIVKKTHPLYDELGVVKELKITFSQWRSYSLRDRALIRVRFAIENMIDTVERFNDEMDEALKKATNG